MSSRTTIIQIIPADGWQVVYDEGNDTEGVNRVVCFALVEEVELASNGQPYGIGALRYVVPMDASDDGEISDAMEAKNFLRVERCLPHERWRSVEKIAVVN